ncbi:(+)-borneol dehydrogenase 1-like [Aristolochia californica]|uniref:(+)-borneol dehydrogenase 1-like n=1 Tax=Aristolochia californica TaxID=171875 RepID=UPI0035DAB27A
MATTARRLEGKVAIITGGASGIGESTARLFWTHGAYVIIADVQAERGKSICEELDDNVIYVHCDVTSENDIRDAVDFAVEKYGKLDIMFNNAGIMNVGCMSILTIEKSQLEKVLQVNLVGAVMGAKHAARVMVPRRQGCILFTGSATASIACMPEHSYVASKRGLLGLAQNLSAELGEFGIRVNCVSPYVVGTNINKNQGPVADPNEFAKFMSEVGNLKGAQLKPDDVARAALYLASDDASYVSGLNLLVDGGFTAANPSLMMAISQLH